MYIGNVLFTLYPLPGPQARNEYDAPPLAESLLVGLVQILTFKSSEA